MATRKQTGFGWLKPVGDAAVGRGSLTRQSSGGAWMISLVIVPPAVFWGARGRWDCQRGRALPWACEMTSEV